jgi:pyridoxine/pyridoxamine 5'-phosphate oxidase
MSLLRQAPYVGFHRHRRRWLRDSKTQIDQLLTGLSIALPHHFGNGNVFIGGTEFWRFGRARLCERHIRKRP